MRSRKHTTVLHAQQCPDLFCHLCPSQRQCLNDDKCRQALRQIHRLFLAWIHIDLTTNSKSSCLIVGLWMAGDQSDCLWVSRVPMNCQENPLWDETFCRKEFQSEPKKNCRNRVPKYVKSTVKQMRMMKGRVAEYQSLAHGRLMQLWCTCL